MQAQSRPRSRGKHPKSWTIGIASVRIELVKSNGNLFSNWKIVFPLESVTWPFYFKRWIVGILVEFCLKPFWFQKVIDEKYPGFILNFSFESIIYSLYEDLRGHRCKSFLYPSSILWRGFSGHGVYLQNWFGRSARSWTRFQGLKG